MRWPLPPGRAGRSRGKRRAWWVGTACAGLLLAGCSGPPWYLGAPLDGRVVIPPRSRSLTVAEHRRLAEQAHAGHRVLEELDQLLALEARGSLQPAERKRLVELLIARARDWSAMHRPIPLADDLRHLVTLVPARAQALSARLRAAEIAAGDTWLALGETGRAEEEYRRAEKLGGESMDFRFRAVWGASVADLDEATLERALAVLPDRSLAPFTAAYLDRAPAPKDALLLRGWQAARVHGPAALLARIEASPASERLRRAPAAGGPPGVAPTPPSPTVREPAPADYLDGGPTLARVLLPAARAYPQILEPGPRSEAWSEKLVAEDPSGPDSLELAAEIDVRARRFGGAARKLEALVFFSSDRAAGHERAARVWESAGRNREACAAWLHATRVGAVDDPRWCGLLACVKRDPGAGNAAAVASHLRDRAPELACVARGRAGAGGAREPAPLLEVGPAEPGGPSPAFEETDDAGEARDGTEAETPQSGP